LSVYHQYLQETNALAEADTEDGLFLERNTSAITDSTPMKI
jgi:hypothetical protein